MSIVQVAVTGVVGAVFDLFFGEMKAPTQRLGDISRQTAKEGEPRQIIFGIVRPIGGNLVAVQEPPRIERRKQKSGGKGGGGGSSQTVEIPRRTYAVGICEGPITGIRRAWRNNKLIYDGRGTEWGAKNNGTFLSRFQFYLGDWDQMPSPNLEAVFGAGNVPAMRGTCYMVAKDEDLQDTGGAVPQWIFEVERAYGYGLTSRPYPVEIREALAVDDGRAAGGQHRGSLTTGEALGSTGGAVVGGVHWSPFASYSKTEQIGMGAGAMLGGSHSGRAQPEARALERLDVTGGAVLEGQHKTKLIRYTYRPADQIGSTGGVVLGGIHVSN